MPCVCSPFLSKAVLTDMMVIAVRHKFDSARRELSRTTARVTGVEDAAETGIADMAIAMAGNRDMRICACAGGVTEGGGSARGRFRALEIL